MLIFKLFININFYQILIILYIFFLLNVCGKSVMSRRVSQHVLANTSVEQSCDFAGKAKYHVFAFVIKSPIIVILKDLSL